MATTVKAILDAMQVAIEARPAPEGDIRGYAWKRLADSDEPREEAGGFRLLLLAEIERDPEFGVDAQETLSAPLSAEFYRAAQADDDASFFAEMSALANLLEGLAYPSGTLAVIARKRTVSRAFSDPALVTGTIALQVKWEQAF